MSTKNSDSCPSPVISRRDAINFMIPQTYNGSPVLGKNRGTTELKLRSSPQAQRLSPRTRAKSCEDLGGELQLANIGHVCLEIWYTRDNELLMIHLVRVDLLAQPSSAAIGTKWDVVPIVKVCLLHKKRSFWDSGQNKARSTLAPRDTICLPVKRDAVQSEVLRLAVFDDKRYNERTPIGFVFIRLQDVDLSWKSSTYVREIVPSSEPTGFSTGRIVVRVNWDSPSEKLRLRIGTAYGLMSPHGTLKRSFFMRMFVFISGVEIKQLKSVAKESTPDVHFNTDHLIDLKSNEIRESCILIQLFGKPREKLSFVPELIGSTIIGPYLPKVFNSFTHWESMIANPMEELADIHALHL